MRQNTELLHRSKDPKAFRLKKQKMWLSESPKWIKEDTNGYGDFLHVFKTIRDLRIFDPVDSFDDYDRLRDWLQKKGNQDLADWIEYNLENYYFPSGAYSEIMGFSLKGYDGYKEGEDGHYGNYCLFDPVSSLARVKILDLTTEEGEAMFFDEILSQPDETAVDDYMDWIDQWESNDEEEWDDD